MEYILVTGGLGYIGSHTVLELLNRNYNVIVVDNLANSKIEVADKILSLLYNNTSKLVIQIYDLNNKSSLQSTFKNYNIKSVIHFAGSKSVKESIFNPIKYYNNITITLNLLEVMKEYDCKSIIFSSSATVYGINCKSPILESSQVGQNITSPYGTSKYMIENILYDLYNSDKTWNIYILRYFNPIGCHPSGLIGEDPNDIPNNLFPYILKVAKGEYSELPIYGYDYNTPDGTCIRDFIHVVDLATAHIACLSSENKGLQVYNVGTKVGTSVKELIDCFQSVNNIKLNVVQKERREGDIEILYSDSSKIIDELNWKPKYNILDMCKHGWNFINSTKN